MRRALTLLVTVVVFAALSASAAAQSRTHVKDVRVGAHEGYQRVVVELDGSADIAWERGPDANQETFYLDADLGKRERVVATKLAQLGTVTLRAMRVGTQLSLEPRERRVRAYLLAKPTRLVIDVKERGEGTFEVPPGLTALAPASSVSPLKNAPIPEPEHAEGEPAPEPVAKAPPKAKVEPAPKAEPAPEPETAAEPETAPEPETSAEANAPESQAQAPAPAPGAETETPSEAEAETPPDQAAQPEPETAPAPAQEPPVAAAQPPAVTVPIPAPAHESPEGGGFPWLLAFGAIAAVAIVGGLGVAIGQMRAPAAPPPPRMTPSRARPSPLGVDAISLDELRGAADPARVLEQRLDDEVRARVALEDRLAQAGEELKVLRDRVHRVERKRDETA
jgi:hypothetical protein